LYLNNDIEKHMYQGSTLTVARLPGASEMRLRASENGTQLASENYFVICSIPEEQND
jgi:hypothetical protein